MAANSHPLLDFIRLFLLMVLYNLDTVLFIYVMHEIVSHSLFVESMLPDDVLVVWSIDFYLYYYYST
jgi:hypothetical protein